MHELHQTIPDPDALLALEPEELGATLLFIMRARLERSRAAICTPATDQRGRKSENVGLLPGARARTKLAVAEAFAWLKVRGC